MVWPDLKVFWLSNEDSIGQVKVRKKKKHKKTGMAFACSARMAEDKTRCYAIVVKSFIVPQQIHKVMG